MTKGSPARCRHPVYKGGYGVVGNIIGFYQYLFTGLNTGGVADENVGKAGDAGVFHAGRVPFYTRNRAHYTQCARLPRYKMVTVYILGYNAGGRNAQWQTQH